MIDFIPLFHCWKLGNNAVFVIAACAKTHEQCLYTVESDGKCTEISNASVMPDVRLLVPCKWQALTINQRAAIRFHFSRFLERHYGAELAPVSSRWDGYTE